MAAVYGFAGLRDYGGELTFRPTMPPYWEMLRFRLGVRGARLEVEVRQGETRYRLLEGEMLELRHRGQRVVLRCGEERTVRDANITVKSWAPGESAEAPRLAM
jgi:alpha,alpha-trehalose phosphorylase